MNPNTVLRPWILACGAQFGIRRAFDYRWPDPESRQHEMYATYQLVSCVPAQDGQQDLSTASGYNVNRKGCQLHRVTCWIDLYNSQDGLYELSAFGVAAHHSPEIRSIFENHGSTYIEATDISNLSTFDDEEILYHHRMTCTFYEYVEISLTEVNALVTSVSLSLDSSDPATVIPGTLETTESAGGLSLAAGSGTIELSPPA